MRSINYLGHYIDGGFEFSEKDLALKTNKECKAHISPGILTIFFSLGQNKYPLRWIKLLKKAKKLIGLGQNYLLKKEQKKLSPLKQIIKNRSAELALIVSRETGKPLWESEGEVKSLLSKIDFVLGEGLNRIKKRDIPKAKGRIRFKSRGLLAVIGPFNFPLHLPLGQILPALIAGNAVLFKPSDKAPASGQKLAEIFHRLKLPSGLFQMLQGGRKVSEKICRHPAIDGVLFTGSFETGQKIKESLIKDHSKILALEMGGYNSALIWKPASLEQAVLETLKGCFWSAGQRCSSTSQIILHKKISKEFIKKFTDAGKKITVDHWSKNPFMGPVIDKVAVQRFFSLEKEIKKRGGRILLEGQRLKNKKGHYVCPGIYKMKFDKNSRFGQKETFTPQAVIYETEDIEEALEMIKHSGYGLSLSVFTTDKTIKEEIFYKAQVGLVNYNLSSIGASSFLPFGGLGKSGNDRPAGAFAIDHCVSPLAEKSKEGF